MNVNYRNSVEWKACNLSELSEFFRAINASLLASTVESMLQYECETGTRSLRNNWMDAVKESSEQQRATTGHNALPTRSWQPLQNHWKYQGKKIEVNWVL